MIWLVLDRAEWARLVAFLEPLLAKGRRLGGIVISLTLGPLQARALADQRRKSRGARVALRCGFCLLRVAVLDRDAHLLWPNFAPVQFRGSGQLPWIALQVHCSALWWASFCTSAIQVRVAPLDRTLALQSRCQAKFCTSAI